MKWKPSRDFSLLVSRKDALRRLISLVTKTKNSQRISYLNRLQKRKSLLCKKVSLSHKALAWWPNSSLVSNSLLSSSLLSKNPSNSSPSNSSSQLNNSSQMPTRTTMETITMAMVKIRTEARVITMRPLPSNETAKYEPNTRL